MIVKIILGYILLGLVTLSLAARFGGDRQVVEVGRKLFFFWPMEWMAVLNMLLTKYYLWLRYVTIRRRK